MNSQTICILGGSGFVGSHLAGLLSQTGYRLRVPTRNRERHRHLLVLPAVEVISCNVHDELELMDIVRGCNAVINLVAILNERRSGDFEKAHVELPKKLARAMNRTGVSRLLHMSALNADAKNGSSAYLRSKGAGEDWLHDQASQGLQVSTFRPSVIFGPGDHFFARFAALLRSTPGPLPLACATARFAPVYVGDVCRAMQAALQDPGTAGQRFELCGPQTFQLHELVEYVNRLSGGGKTVLPLGNGASALLARLMGVLPGAPLTYDNYLSTKVDSVCSAICPLLEGRLTPIDAIVPSYLGGKHQQANYDQLRLQGRSN